jgi:hypothetical protein
MHELSHGVPLFFTRQHKMHSHSIKPMPYNAARYRHSRSRIGDFGLGLQRQHEHSAHIPTLFCRQVRADIANVLDLVSRRDCAVPVISYDFAIQIPLRAPLLRRFEQPFQKTHYLPANMIICRLRRGGFAFGRLAALKKLRHLFRRTDQQFIPHLSLRGINSVFCELQNAHTGQPHGPNAEATK